MPGPSTPIAILANNLGCWMGSKISTITISQLYRNVGALCNTRLSTRRSRRLPFMRSRRALILRQNFSTRALSPKNWASNGLAQLLAPHSVVMLAFCVAGQSTGICHLFSTRSNAGTVEFYLLKLNLIPLSDASCAPIDPLFADP